MLPRKRIEPSAGARRRANFFGHAGEEVKKEREAPAELLVIAKTYDLVLWSCHHTGKFPRNHRFVLGERIERTLYGLLETRVAQLRRS